eukprot:TRINITY_DN70312_c0_g1_i1.p1 TRINITY_DN70312_c0_g1~~TRINITY_DN70312_c0_g1_i1.p1  ORF type:complete len:559 (+),score=219.49 TRINITY_DN70312_c0_g1_i1:72-1679(+)
MALAPVEGLGVRGAAHAYDEGTLKRVARFCSMLQRADKPRKETIEELKNLAERAGADDVIAGAITRHIKFSSGPRLLLCWYLLDILAKTNPDTFGIAFGPQILDLATDHMSWTDPKEEVRYVKLVETWRMLFGDPTCEDIFRRKEIRKAEWAAEQEEKQARVARGEILPADAQQQQEEGRDKPKHDSMALILGGVRDGQIVEYQAPCKYYLLGLCENPNCPRPHPKGMFASVNASKVFADWKCLRCGYENPANKMQCWRRDCVGTRPEDLYVPRQKQENPFRKQFGYDPNDEKEAVEHFEKQGVTPAAWRAERSRRYRGVWEAWRSTPPDLEALREYLRTPGGGSQAAAEQLPQVRPCGSCGAPLKGDAVFCVRCGARQQPQAAPAAGERDDLFFPSTRLARGEVPAAQVSATVAEMLHLCEQVLEAPDPAVHAAGIAVAMSRARADPGLPLLPSAALAPVLRAVSRVYSQWAPRRPLGPVVDMLRQFADLRPSLNLNEVDDSAFSDIVAALELARRSGGAPPPPPPLRGGGVSL